MQKNRPQGRKVFQSGGGKGAHKTGAGTGSGGVGGGSFFGEAGGSSGHGSGSSHGSGGGVRSVTRSKPGFISIIVVILAMLFGGGGVAMNGLSGGDMDYQDSIQTGSGSYSGWTQGSASSGNTGVLNTRVSSDAREKFTQILGDGKDTVTIMVYMCGTDLESQSAMATSDLNEMISATVGSKINLLVYTGGCKKWRNSTVSSSNNQVYQISGGNIRCLISNAGNAAMTKPDTLASFIRWANQNYPANRTALIFWDHGGGSISGYGYDEKYPSSGSMTLSGINTALKTAGIKYDFIGFDACLMATTETALVLGNYADYLIGSEETEPGIGWYYTNWLTSLSNNSSLSTLEIGKQIADDFTRQCAKSCPGQSTTLSVTDLAELSQTLPDKLNAFAEDATALISDGDYRKVATARSSSKEFARSSGIDQVDLIHFAKQLNTSASKKLADTLSEAVKYNVTSSNTANAYGLSIYFPYKTLNKVDRMASTYQQIGLDDNYTSCIRKFAQMQVSGQAAGGGTISPFSVLSGGSTSSYGSQDLSSQAIQQLIGTLLSGRFSDFKSLGIDGLDRSNTGFLSEDPLDAAAVADYVASNRISAADLQWQTNDEGKQCIRLTDDQWETIEMADMNMFYDDGEGYIDLGLDNIYDFDDDGNLLPNLDHSWISLDKQPVAYYHMETQTFDDGTYSITGFVPVRLNGEDARLILTFDADHEQGFIAGVSYDYDEDVTETQAKTLPGLERGDRIKFLCDYYSYQGKFSDSYQLGDTLTVQDPDDIEIANTNVGSGSALIVYKFTDMYGQEYWTPVLGE